MQIVIVGASGGIGLALVRRCLEVYPGAGILASYHRSKGDLEHPDVQWVKLDVTSEEQIAQLAGNMGPVDLLINAVGFLHAPGHRPERSIKSFDKALFDLNMTLNTLPSILLAKYFEPSLRAAEGKSFLVSLSARIGSIKDNNIGGWLSYRTSKAALNMAMKTVSIEWRSKLPNCCVLLFHPGTTDTELSRPFQKNLPEGQLHSAAFTAESLLNLVSQSGPGDSGRFVSFDGADIDW